MEAMSCFVDLFAFSGVRRTLQVLSICILLIASSNEHFLRFIFLKKSLSRFQVLVLNKSFVFSCLVLFARDPVAGYRH